MLSQTVLLLNASNLEKFPVYPYAFIQVSAVARRAGIEVVCQDMLGIPREAWAQTIQGLIERHDPAMILITLRNTDSLASPDYERDGLKEGGRSAYFPIERTRDLIAAIRAVSDLEVAVGGFGFSLLPNELMHYLRPDFGVVGGPDDFFAHFEAIRNGNPDKVTSLLFFREGQLISNPRRLYPPLADAEYTPQAIEEMLEFYAAFPSPGFQGAPVEIMRGCGHACVFCAEPHSAGRKVRYRDLSAVMKDIEILADHGITRIYMISSELNPEGNGFVLQLADRIQAFNETQTDERKITWYGANYLLCFTSDEYERLYRSGFTGGWFDITGLDDENARAMRTPYRNAQLLTHLKTYAEWAKKRRDLQRAQKALQSETTTHAGDGREDEFVSWSMFLGNPATTIETIRDTLQTANREGLPNLFDRCGIIGPTRVFDYEEPSEATRAATYSVTLDLKRTGYQQLLPSFTYPPALLQDFGSEAVIAEMFDHIAETYLSTKYLETRDWPGFLRQNATALQELLSAQSQAEQNRSNENSAKQIVESLLAGCLEAFPDFIASFGLPSTVDALGRTTPYELALMVFSRWRTEKELLDEVSRKAQFIPGKATHALLLFCVQAILYKFNVRLRPDYRPLFIEEQQPAYLVGLLTPCN